jgi:hypothetical protein
MSKRMFYMADLLAEPDTQLHPGRLIVRLINYLANLLTEPGSQLYPGRLIVRLCCRWQVNNSSSRAR